MTTLTSKPAVATPPSRSPRSTPWSWPQYLALIGLPILVVEIWTVVAWLSDHPYSITKYRDHSATSWWLGIVLEVAVWAISIPIAVWVVRGCIQARRLTFDGAFCLVGMTIFWTDTNANFFNPTLLFSSNLVNVNSPLGHMPFKISPSIGSMPDPLLFTIPIESFVLLGVIIVIGRAADALRRRYPGLSTARFIAVLFVGAFVVDIVIEGIVIAAGIWTYTAPAGISLPFGGGRRYPLPEILAGATFFLAPALLRMYKNDRGETLVERGLSNRPARVRVPLLLLAMYAFTELLVWGPGVVPDMAFGFYEQRWPTLSQNLVNNVCNAPGITDSPYGPCPGSPGYRLPGPFTPHGS